MKKIIFLLVLSMMCSVYSQEQNKGENAPKLGDTLPNITLGEKTLDEHLEKGKVLLTVYRGSWCPYCVKQLKNYQENLDKFKTENIQIIAISPEKKKNALKMKEKNNLEFEVLSDKNHKMLRELNLVFKLKDETVEKYIGYGIDLEESQGNTKNELPIPATYLIDKKRKIIYSFIDFDYKKRASVEDILAAVKK